MFRFIKITSRFSGNNVFPPKRSYSSGILSGVNVLDMTRIIAGPYCSMMLGDLGANVIKVESFEGDETRKWGPRIQDCKDSYYYTCVNRNKKSICVNLKNDEGKQIVYDLAKKCSIMVENFIPGKLNELGVGYEKMTQVNPQIIYCALTGYGHVGPYAQRPGYDVIASAVGGLMNITGEKDGNPVKVGVAMTDVMTGIHAFGAIMAALYHRKNTGRGQKIDCNLLSTQISGLINAASIYINTGIEPERWGTQHANVVPYQAFKTKDGFFVVGAASDSQFSALCKVLNEKELANDNRFKTNVDRVKNRVELIKILGDIFVTKSTKEWSTILKHAPFPNGPVNTMKQVFEDEHVKEIKLVKEVAHPEAGTIKVVGPPTVYSLGGNEVRSAPPLLGEHTQNILTSFLGYDDKKVEKLFADKIVK